MCYCKAVFSVYSFPCPPFSGPQLRPLIQWNYPAAPLLPEHSSHLVMILSFIPVAFRPDQQQHRVERVKQDEKNRPFDCGPVWLLSWVCYQWISSPGETAVGCTKGTVGQDPWGIRLLLIHPCVVREKSLYVSAVFYYMSGLVLKRQNQFIVLQNLKGVSAWKKRCRKRRTAS